MSDLLKNFTVSDNFLGRYERLVNDVVIPYQEKVLNDEIEDAEKSHAIENFRAAAKMIATGKCDEEFYGMVFQDSDVAKWLEAAAYTLLKYPDQELEKRCDEVIDLIGQAQHEDGYLNTYFTVKEPDKRWTNLQEAHELYCAGHMMEAAVAYAESTGKTKLLSIMSNMADHMYQRFFKEGVPGYSGHPEVELALMRLYRCTRNEKYKELAEHFINVRGVDSDYFSKERQKNKWTVWGSDPSNKEYTQSHAPVREQVKAVGHAVRAVYLYTGMADVASETKDQVLANACETLWENITESRMYVTGAIGSAYEGEAFTKDYHLPNDTAYAETCASIGLIFFSRKMLDLNKNGKYADVMERALYNCVLAGMQLDGERFFYVNPLEVIPGISGESVTHHHALPQRPKWFACACCPPNVARLL
ncbi:MAG TPA: beta-L-arabinofuranosidase domain-containing protein, partial [Lachnospiraceae bacterium]|nr:beta-L-arabinofuranosidase domain-containing protein [Lachnospiraceae bacterium]